jgi:hypothetical protein
MPEEVATGAETPTTPPPSEEGTTPKVFDEDYVKNLRDEAAKHRHEKKAADEKAQAAAQRLLEARVEALGTDLADPTDLFAWTASEALFDEDGLPDDDAIKTAIEGLLEKKPHLRTRDARGDIDQGGRGENVETFSFNDWIKSAAT